MMDAEADLDAGVGGPGPEDYANGGAALAAALIREAHTLAATASALRAAVAPEPGEAPSGPLADVRRRRVVVHAVGEAAVRAALLLETADVLAEGGDAAVVAERIAAAAKAAGLAPAALAGPLRTAALSPATDDGAARIAAAAIAAELTARLAG